MCGRYSLKENPEDLARGLGVKQLQYEFTPRYNIAPTQLAPVICDDGDYRVLKPMRWGLIPSWSKDESLGLKCINARIETIAQKPAYRAALKSRRCLVPADGFYEWLRIADIKQPFHFQIGRAELFCFAGVWERWRNPAGETVETFSIITQAGQEPVSLVHDRMPKILSQDQWDSWLDPRQYQSVLEPKPLSDKFEMFAVRRVVNSSRNEGPNCSLRLFSTCGDKRYEVGDLVTVTKCPGGYSLPEGLPEGARVKVLAHGNPKMVEFEGKMFQVAPQCIESGLAFEIDGRWIADDDPEIEEALRVERAAKERRISPVRIEKFGILGEKNA